MDCGNGGPRPTSRQKLLPEDFCQLLYLGNLRSVLLILLISFLRKNQKLGKNFFLILKFWPWIHIKYICMYACLYTQTEWNKPYICMVRMQLGHSAFSVPWGQAWDSVQQQNFFVSCWATIYWVLLWIRQQGFFIGVFSFNPHKQLGVVVVLLWFSTDRWRNWGSESGSDLPKVTLKQYPCLHSSCSERIYLSFLFIFFFWLSLLPEQMERASWWLSRKESACNAEAAAGDRGSIPEWGRSPGGGNGSLLQCSCLESPMDGGI